VSARPPQLVRPADVGLPATGRRRTPGLRREEVAELAGVGLSWYTWLEQGRVRASGHVLDAVGRVLGLDPVGRRHLRALARWRAGRPSGPRTTGRMRNRSGRRPLVLDVRTCRMVNTIAAAASSPGMTDSRIAVRTPTRATRPRASNGPTMAPRLSMVRSNPNARP
jgi:transcriptional regulator with XRE-family HTH domain